MKRTLLLAAAVAVALASGPIVAGEHHARKSSHEAQSRASGHAGKWTTDAAVREGMLDIRTAMRATLAAIHNGTVQPQHYVALGETIDRKIGEIAAGNTLPPAAEDALHTVLYKLWNAANALKEGHGDEPMEHAAALFGALDDYALAFEHPGWQPQQRNASNVLTLKEAKRHIQAQLPGRITDARADWSDADPLHYHVDVRLINGGLARLNVDAASAQVSWRDPAAESHDHGHGAGHAPQKLKLDNGRKWTTDAPLRQYMGELHAAMSFAKEPVHKGRFTPAEYQALGQTVEYRVGQIVADCKLPPEADANLHIVVADLLAAADVLQGKAPGKPQESAHRVALALNQYGKHFDHPGWKPL